MEGDEDYEHKTIDEILESEQKKKKRQKILEKVNPKSSTVSQKRCNNFSNKIRSI
jgi:hypothetical protein